MNDNDRNRVTMYNTAANWLDKNIGKMTAPPKLQEAFDSFKGHIAEIDRLASITGVTTGGFTESKVLARENAQKVANHVIALLKAYATSVGDVVLLNDVDFPPSALRNASEQVLKARLDLVIGKAETHQAAAAGYGLSPKLVKALKTALADFAGKMTTTREAIGNRKGDNQQLDGAIDDADEVLKGRMDVYMEVVQFTEPPMYDQYKAARVIVDR